MSCSKILSKDECESILLQKLNAKSFKLISYDISPFSKDINGFLGEHLRLRCHVQIDSDFQTVNFFLKKVLTNVDCVSNFVSKAINETTAFQKEILFYDLLIKDKIHEWAPRYYPLENKSVIILEDLSQEGYRLTNKTGVDLDECKAAFRAVAGMHALGLHFQSTLSRPVDIVFPLLFEESFYDYELLLGSRWLESGSKFTKIALDHFLTSNVNEIKRKFDEELKFEISKSLKPSDKFTNVLCHRDLYFNNMLFIYDENGKAKNCVLIDFQLTRYLPPAYDLLFFLYSVTTPEFRRKNLYNVLNYYYEQLAQALESFGLDIVNILSKSDFFKNVQNTMGFAKLIAAIQNQFRFCDEKVYRKAFSSKADNLDMILGDRSQVLLDELKNSPDYRKRYFEVLDELVEYLIDPTNLREQKYDGYRCYH